MSGGGQLIDSTKEAKYDCTRFGGTGYSVPAVTTMPAVTETLGPGKFNPTSSSDRKIEIRKKRDFFIYL